MIKKLRIRFIITAMSVVGILLIAVFILQNTTNFADVNSHAEMIMEELAVNYNQEILNRVMEEGTEEEYEEILASIEADSEGSQKKGNEPGEGQDPAEAEESEGISSTGLEPKQQPPAFDEDREVALHFSLFSAPVIGGNDLMSSAYFTVELDQDGNIVRTDVSHVTDITEEEANNLVIALRDIRKTEGWYDNLKYRVTSQINDNYLYLFLDRKPELDSHIRARMISLVAVIGAFLGILLAVILLSKRIIRPIAENIERQKEFVAYAGHEIKTPLAIIQANTEVLELHTGESKWTNNIKDQIQNLSVLMNNMLTLSKAEEPQVVMVQEELDLGEILRKYANMFSESASIKNVSINCDPDRDLIIKAGRSQIGQVISIVIDNAVKYARNGTDIDIKTTKKDKIISVEVKNITDLMPNCEPDRLFERFYRPDASRFSEVHGNGVGLSAAKALTELYSGSINCRYEGDDTIVFTLNFKR